MVDPLILLAFVPAALALNLTPGADMMFCLAQGLRGDARAAVAASAGISLGGLVHVGIAGLGLGAAVAAFPWIFDVIRWLGVAYLLWLAWQAFTAAPVSAETPAIRPGQAFRAGLLVNLTNPKVILFVLAFVPQFVVPEAGPILLQFLLFGAVMGVGGFFINAGVGIFAGRARRWLAAPGLSRWTARVSGAIFAGLALRLAFLERT